MASMIEKISVADDRFGTEWGVQVNDYKLDGVQRDLQDLLVAITQQRALSIEAEVLPMEDVIRRRNEKLAKYGKVLQALTQLQSMFTSESEGTTMSISITSLISDDFTDVDFWNIMAEIGHSGGSGYVLAASKAETDGLVSRCKSRIDEMNNESQKDMNRLQALVDRRDESYSTATSLMTSVSDTRSSLIKNLN